MFILKIRVQELNGQSISLAEIIGDIGFKGFNYKEKNRTFIAAVGFHPQSNWGEIAIYPENENLQKINYRDSERLTLSCDNLEKVLKRLLENIEKREEISEWLELFIPEFDRIEVQKSDFSSNENLLIYQKHWRN